MNFDLFKGLNYEPQDAEDEVLLSEIPLELLMSSIESQFKNPMEYNQNDFLQSFQTKYAVTKENMTEDEKEEVELYYDKFISFMEKIFKEVLSIGFPELEDSPEEDQLELLHYTYRYFILNIKKNFSNFLMGYIEQHKDTLGASLPKRKNVTTINLSRDIEDEDAITIISGIDECIDLILSKDITVDEFIALSHSDKSNLECEYIEEMYDNFKITGNFVASYIKIMNDEFRVEVESRVRNKFLKKYRKK